MIDIESRSNPYNGMTAPQEMYLFIADISGYTSFMIQNKKEYAHATTIITSLIQSLADQVQIPFEISKIEGDALFLTVLKEKLPPKMDPQTIRKKILYFFTIFYKKISELQHSIICSCGGCKNIDQLKLKIIAHYGTAEPIQVGPFSELSGVDVIIVHRLLKNKIEKHCYFLMTKPAFDHLQIPDDANLQSDVFIDKDLGKIPFYVYYPLESEPQKNYSMLFKMKTLGKLIWVNLLTKIGLQKKKPFHHISLPD